MDNRIYITVFVVLLIVVIILFGIVLLRNQAIPIITDNNTTNHTNTTVPFLQKEISIASWNLQIFGPSKASNQTLVNYYVDKLDEYDIFVIQEIRDVGGTAITILANKFPNYNYIISNRAGQSSSKEQYAIFYKKNITLMDSYDYQEDYQKQMQRPPLKATFSINNWSFTLYTIHTQPDNVEGELSILETIVRYQAEDTIILGDLNADGDYYNETLIQHFRSWYWVITNDMDTTVANTSNTYDRILLNHAANNNLLSVGIMKDVNSEQSDHYLIYGNFTTEHN